MAFNRPTLQELFERIAADFRIRLGATGSFLRRSVTLVIAKVLAGVAHLLYGYLDYIAEQVFPDTADDANALRWGSIWDVERTPATFASGVVQMPGTNGSTIPDDTLFRRSDGVEYRSQGEVTVASGVANVSIQAVVAGADGECDLGVELTLVSPIAGVDSTGTVDEDGITGGNDEEPLKDYRLRILEKIANPPMGGTKSDYEKWAKEVPGVTRAWCYPTYNGPGTVAVAFVRDNDDNFIPDASEVQEVADYIETVRPITASNIHVFAPTGDPINYSIALAPDTAANRAAVQAELEDMTFRDGVPGGTIYLSRINEAISIAEGEFDHILSAPLTNHVSPSGYIPTVGTITWV